jgi:hypothetical protein
MFGPEILARSLSVPNVTDSGAHDWQYHSRSDQHSKIACWALLFDLLETCPLLRKHVEAGKVGFGINHEMREFKSGRKKNLDLVLCTHGTGARELLSFADLAARYRVLLTVDEWARLGKFPPLWRVPVGSVFVALEAKACMTEHIKALPRLYDELNSSHLAIHGAAHDAIAAGFAVVNMAPTFLSPGLNKDGPNAPRVKVTKHKQPDVTVRTVEKLKEIPRRMHSGTEGFDALGIVVLNLQNDGSPVTIVTNPPAPEPGDVCHYDQMIRRIAALYATRFAHS